VSGDSAASGVAGRGTRTLTGKGIRRSQYEQEVVQDGITGVAITPSRRHAAVTATTTRRGDQADFAKT
jgi:hypothetical protein